MNVPWSVAGGDVGGEEQREVLSLSATQYVGLTKTRRSTNLFICGLPISVKTPKQIAKKKTSHKKREPKKSLFSFLW